MTEGMRRHRLPWWLAAASAVVVSGVVVLLTGLLAVGAWFVDSEGVPRRFDFLAFWSAARLALRGAAAAAYDPASLATVHEGLGATGFGLPLYWLNPPSFLLLLTPFALLPYPSAFVAWTVTSAAAYALAMRAVLPAVSGAWLASLALPGVFICLWHGQSALLVVALFTGCFALMPLRPVLAGVCLGLASIKPQFGVLMPLLLALAGQWRCFGAAAATVIALGLVATAAFGPDAWLGFLSAPGRVLDSYLSDSVLDTLQSVYGTVAMRAGPGWLAWGLHMAIGAGAAAVCVLIWRRGGSMEAKAAAAISGAYLLPPYMLQYELVAVGAAAAFLLRAGLQRGFLAGEAALLGLAVVLPSLSLLNRVTLVGLAAFGIVLLLSLRRFAAERAAVTTGGSARGSSDHRSAPP